MRYPDECPVFNIDGEHYEVRPLMSNELDRAYGELIAVDGSGMYHTFLDERRTKPTKPLTIAAYQLLRWSRQP